MEVPATSPLHQAFCANLRAARKAKGLTQVDVAEMLGVAQPTYANFEAGKNGPTLATIERLAEILGVRPSELLEDAVVAR